MVRKRSVTVLIAVVASQGFGVGCRRSAFDDAPSVVVDLNKAAGVNVCPDRIPELPHANTDLTILLPPQTPPGKYDVVVYRAAPVHSIGQTGTVVTDGREATLRVKLDLAQLEPGVYTVGISMWPKVFYCDVRVR
jgi:hypothetical protein